MGDGYDIRTYTENVDIFSYILSCITYLHRAAYYSLVTPTTTGPYWRWRAGRLFNTKKNSELLHISFFDNNIIINTDTVPDTIGDNKHNLFLQIRFLYGVTAYLMHI